MTSDLPPVHDGYGYSVRCEDLKFLQIDVRSVHALEERRCPLGMTEIKFKGFATTLGRALDDERLYDCDVRIQGSAAKFFAGHHKKMLWMREEIVEEFRTLRGRIPLPYEVDEIVDTLNRVWPCDMPRPRRRPFDAFFKCGLDRMPSDFDIQVSSDEINRRVHERIRLLQIPLLDAVTITSTYAFFRKDLIVDTCPHLTRWATLQSDVLGRLVALAAFPGSGPPNVESVSGPLSSHFRDSDWKLL